MIASAFIKMFGSYLISIHVFDAILFAFMGLMLYRMIRWKCVIVLPIIMFFVPSGYNLFSLFWLMLIIYLIHIKKDNEYVIAFIIGLLFITKQNLGIFLFIPCFYYSKHKIKSIIIFLLPFLVVFCYFFIQHGFY